MKYSLCDGWEFTAEWNGDFPNGGGSAQPVRLPHTCRELPLHCIEPDDYQMLCGYRRDLAIPAELSGKRLFLQFDGAAHIAAVYVNGKEAAVHRCGYTAFRAEVTGLITYGETNRLAVKLDTSENPSIPPFGFVVDYLTYGGLYREAWLDVRESGYITDIFVTTPTLTQADVRVSTDGASDGAKCEVSLINARGDTVYTGEQGLIELPNAEPWSTESPVLYRCAVRLLTSDGRELDNRETTFGFRTAEFKADGFYLNGKKTFLRGLNRHQSFPYVGYAAPEALQREDARILKEELGCSAVRTSHYPQSQYFIDECDRLGLLVFTEIPGWQHIGDDKWKEQACENLREMVLQYRNHPSVILWGVRINESQDDDEFYARTNAIAHELDPSRQTSGVRYLEKSSLLEDVYAFNDFSHDGKTPGVKPKKAVTPDMGKAILVSECNGHMFPTKPFDAWEKRQEHALRHARVQNAALKEHAGCFGWCMFDYPTHKDFGSGDRICYHGVMDAFRNPKLAAAFYASQGDGAPVLEVCSSMDIGDYPAGNVGDVYVFSNADEVKLYKNDVFVTRLSRGKFAALAHPPFVLDDTVGELLETREGFSPSKAKILKECLLAAGKYGLSGLPLKYKLKMLWCMARYGLKFKDGVDLYGKYIANWGGAATCWRFDGIKDGKVVSSVTCRPSAKLHLDVKASHTELTESASYDMAAVRVRILDENGNAAPYAQLPVMFSVSGDAELVGPAAATAEGGMCGAYVRTLGRAGAAELTVHTEQTEDVAVSFNITIGEEKQWN
ncbi:MAG: glycoside hydrolase family 2 protein [Lachnospiraceae bacterium]|nr:glycoside hydrolase family 2 protein [Ruminococcus sp.]MCM1275957.1 glycoside hydrolase family 2 protein [Lachnospiraceae bacterium]